MNKVLTCLKFLIVFTIYAVTAIADDSGLVVSWDFNNATGETLASVSGETAGEICNLGVNAKWVEGKTGKALLFTGITSKHNCGGVHVPKSPVDFTKSFTVEVMLKLQADAPYREFKEILSWSDGGRGPGVRIYSFYGAMTIRTGDGDKDLTSVRTNPATVKIPTERWFHMMVTYDADAEESTIYFDGSKVAAGPLKITPRAKSNDISIGSYRAGYAYALHGAIDNLKIYAEAKNENEVAAAYLVTHD